MPTSKSRTAKPKLRGLRLLAVAALFAAQKHRDQTRKSGLPYIVHPIEVFLVLVWAGVRSPPVLAIALLHDTIEETQTGFAELQELFGEEIAASVLVLSDDKTLARAERKRLQVIRATDLPRPAQLVRLADKIVNTIEMPAAWDPEQKQSYFEEARRVREALRGTHQRIEALFDRAYSLREQVIAGGSTTIIAFLLGRTSRRMPIRVCRCDLRDTKNST